VVWTVASIFFISFQIESASKRLSADSRRRSGLDTCVHFSKSNSHFLLKACQNRLGFVGDSNAQWFVYLSPGALLNRFQCCIRQFNKNHTFLGGRLRI